MSALKMNPDFPPAVPEIPVQDIDNAADYYENHLGFKKDWGDQEGGIAGISKGHCRLFLTNPPFRQTYGNSGPVLIWINLNSREQVDQLHELWRGARARIVSAPEDKPWNLHEFTATDLDGNLLRVFYDLTGEDVTKS